MKRLSILLTAMLILTLLLTACAEDAGNRPGQNGSEGGFGQSGALSGQANDDNPGAIPNTGDESGSQFNFTPAPDQDASGIEENDDDKDEDKDKNKDKDKDKDKGRADKGKGNDNKGKDKDKDEKSDGDDRDDYDAYAVEDGLLPLSALDGATVLNRGGNPIGTIDGVVMDENSGQVPYLIFNPDDDKKELNLEGKLVAIPLSAFGTEEAIRPEKKEDRERMRDRAVLVFDRDESVLKKAPAFENDDALSTEMDDIQAYWQDEGRAIPVTGRDGSVRRMSSDDFENLAVYDREGQQIGTIRDIVVDLSSGETHYYLVDLNDNADDDGYLLITADQFSREGLANDQRGFVLMADAVTLDQAPRVNDREDIYQFGK